MEQRDHVISAQPPPLVDGDADPPMSDDDDDSFIENLLRCDPIDFDLWDLMTTDDDIPPPPPPPPPPQPQVLIGSAESYQPNGGITMGRGRTMNDNGEKMKKRSKCMSPQELAELFKTDPEKAKRIVSNRNAAARSKEKKIRNALAAEQRVQYFQIQKEELYVRLQNLQRKIENLSIDNKRVSLGTLNLWEQTKTLEAQSQSLQGQVEILKVKMYENYDIIGNVPCGELVSQLSSMESESAAAPQNHHHQPANSSQAAPPEPQFYIPPPSPPPPPTFGEAFELFSKDSNGSNNFSDCNHDGLD